MTEIDRLFAMLDGVHKSIQTACIKCDADVEFTKDIDNPNVSIMRIMHEDDCEVLAEVNRARGEAGSE